MGVGLGRNNSGLRSFHFWGPGARRHDVPGHGKLMLVACGGRFLAGGVCHQAIAWWA
jgi:hypothetical protein